MTTRIDGLLLQAGSHCHQVFDRSLLNQSRQPPVTQDLVSQQEEEWRTRKSAVECGLSMSLDLWSSLQ